MHLKTRGLVLRVSAYNDTDALLTLLTQEHGRLTAKVRGLKRKNNPMFAPCQLLAYSEFVLFENKGLYTVNEAESVELFHSLRGDLQKLSLGTYFVQVAELICQEDMPDPVLLPLVLNSLFALSKLGIREGIVKAAFELRIACISGYMPSLNGCIHCGETFADRLNLSEGHLECRSCGKLSTNGIRMPVTGGALDAMRYICHCEPKKIFSFQIGEDNLRCLCQLTESYLLTQLERGFSSLDFYKSLFDNGDYNV